MDDRSWVRCPVCGGKTRVKVLPGTELVHFPLYCPKCHCESVVDYAADGEDGGAEAQPEQDVRATA